MKYANKEYRGYFSIWACFNGKWEKVDDCNGVDNAMYLANEYQLAYGRDTVVEIRKHGKRFEV